MNRILTFAAVIAVGAASFSAFAQPPANAPEATPYGKFRPLEGRQAAVPEEPPATPEKAPEAPAVQPAPATEQLPATAVKETPTQSTRRIPRAPHRYWRGAGFGHAYPDDPRARYLARKRMMYQRNQYRRYAPPQLGQGHYRRLGFPYGMPAPYPRAQPGPGAAAPGTDRAPEAGTQQPGY